MIKDKKRASAYKRMKVAINNTLDRSEKKGLPLADALLILTSSMLIGATTVVCGELNDLKPKKKKRCK